MLSTKAEERPTEKHAESKMLARCMLGNAWLAHYCVSLFNLVRPLGLINNKDGELENCCPASWNVEAKTTIDELRGCHHICCLPWTFSLVEKYHHKWKKLKYRKIFFLFFAGRANKDRNLPDYHHNVGHHIKIISHDRDYSNVDVHDCRPCSGPRRTMGV